MSKKETQLPDYEKPPVIEVVFGVQFKKLNNLSTPHIGKFWECLGIDNYPDFQEMPELSHIIEKEDSLQSPDSNVEYFQVPPLPRLFFIDSDKDHIVQIQRDRLLVNWRKLTQDQEYPKYASLLPRFCETLDIFKEFVKSCSIGEIEPDQYELTYVNHIDREGAWKEVKDINFVFPEFSCSEEGTFLSEPENVSWRKIYKLPENRGRLYATMNQAINKDVYILNMTARGYIEGDYLDWFKQAHEWIVLGFSDLTGEQIQREAWGKK